MTGPTGTRPRGQPICNGRNGLSGPARRDAVSERRSAAASIRFKNCGEPGAKEMKRRMVSGERNAINMAFRVAFKILFLLFTIHYSLLTRLAFGQTLVQVSDTLYNADGTKASGRMIISWDPF